MYMHCTKLSSSIAYNLMDYIVLLYPTGLFSIYGRGMCVMDGGLEWVGSELVLGGRLTASWELVFGVWVC